MVQYLIGALELWIFLWLSIQLGLNNHHWRSPSFFRGVGGYTTSYRNIHQLRWHPACWSVRINSWWVNPMMFNGLVQGKIYRNPPDLMVKTMVSCRFFLKPIHWDVESRQFPVPGMICMNSRGFCSEVFFFYIYLSPLLCGDFPTCTIDSLNWRCDVSGNPWAGRDLQTCPKRRKWCTSLVNSCYLLVN